MSLNLFMNVSYHGSILQIGETEANKGQGNFQKVAEPKCVFGLGSIPYWEKRGWPRFCFKAWAYLELDSFLITEHLYGKKKLIESLFSRIKTRKYFL